MRGHIRQRSPGHWAIILDLHGADGKRRRKWHSFAGTKREAQKECARLIAAIEQQAYVEPTRITVGEYLDRWLAGIKPAVATRTYERYAGLIRNNLTPRLGGFLLRKLQSADIRQTYADAHAGGLAGYTVRHMHAVLNQALPLQTSFCSLTRAHQSKRSIVPELRSARSRPSPPARRSS